MLLNLAIWQVKLLSETATGQLCQKKKKLNYRVFVKI